MKNPADLLEVSQGIIDYVKNGDPAKDVIENSAFTENELIYKLALFYVSKGGK